MKLITSILIFLIHFSLLSQTTVWQNDFSNPSTWVVNNSGQTGPQFGWSIDATRDGWWAPATAIASTSEGNYAELTNGNPTSSPGTQALNVTYTLTTAQPISLATSGTQVSLEFLQFGARFNDLQEIQISTNGTTFTTVGNNNDFPILSASGGSAYPNPSTKIINLAPYLNGATQVWIRFSWTTNFPGQGSNSNVWVTYGWYIDDVKIIDPNCTLSPVNVSQTTSSCDSFTINNQTLTQNGILHDTIYNLYGCPTIINNYNVTIYNSFTQTIPTNISICQGDTFTFYNQSIINDGIYNHTLQTIHGCDSIISINVNHYNSIDTLNINICSGSNYWFNGVSYTQTGLYTNTLISSHGCDSTITLNLTVSPPISNLFNTTICPGSSYTLNGQTYSTAGTFNQYFQTQNGCDSILYITISLLPNIFNPTLSSNQQLFTSPPFAVQFSNTTANFNNFTYTWYWGDGTSSSSNNPTVFHEYLSNGLYTVTLLATNIQTGCTDETTYTDYIYTTGGVSCTHNATINQTGPINSCSGQSVVLTCNSDPNFTYQWRKNGVYISGNNNDSLIVNQSGAYAVIISVNGCPVASGNVVVNFQTITPPTISASGSIQPCSGSTITLTANSGYTNYLWSNGTTTQNAIINTSGNYTVTVTAANGCTATSSPYTVNASALPSQNICVVGIDSLTNHNRIVWEKPVTSAIESYKIYKESNVSNIYTQIGTRPYDSLSVWIDLVSNPAVQAYRYKITALDTCGMETPLSDFHKTIHLTINQGIGGAWNLIWSHYEGINFGSYNIYRGTSPSNMSLLTTIQSNLNSYTDLSAPTGAVYYQIEIINPNNCNPTKSVNYGSAKSNIVNNGQNNINEVTTDFISVFPNPTNNDITVSISESLINEKYTIQDNSGRIIKNGVFLKTKEKIDLSLLSNGIYFLTTENKNIQKMIVKQ